MAAQHWEQVAELFAQLTTVPPDQRAAYLRDACGNDSELQDELVSLLKSHDVSTGPLDAPPKLTPGDTDSVEPQDGGLHVGPYRLIRPIGEGGMGSVWLAERTDGLMKRAVALKRPHVSWIGTLTERMARERDILAGLEHPNIARLYDAGVTAEGVPYLALEYIEGAPITAYCNRERLPVRRRLELFLQVLDAVRYAHTHLVIHRDIKPSNILVSAAGRIHLLDFGIAKLLQPEVRDEVGTQWGAALTPDYASPEQISGGAVSTASDVYSLGVLLTELLSGARPYELKRDSRGALEDAILEAEPRAPSRNVRPEAAQARGTSVRALTRALQGDLDNIVLKTLHKNPQARYATADLLAQDIGRHLQGEPILAQRGSTWYYAGKFLRRHKLAVGSAATVVGALVVGLAVALTQAERAERQSARAEVEARTSKAVEGFLKDIFLANSRAQPDPVKARLTTARELLALGVKKIGGSLDDAPAAKLRTLKTLADLQHQLALDEEAVTLDREQVALARSLYGPNDPRVVEALVDLSGALMAAESNADREGVLKEALAILDKNKDFSSQLRGNVLGDFAQWSYDHDLQKTLVYAQESVRLLRRYSPSTDLVEALIMEGVTRSQLGQYTPAEPLLTEALSVATTLEGASGPNISRIHAYRAEIRYFSGNWQAAELDLREGYRVARLLGGEEDMQTIQIQQRLGLFLVRTLRAKEAMPYVEQARAAVLKTSPDDDPYFVPMTIETSGFVLGETGDLDAGLRDLRLANAAWHKHHPGSSDIISGAEREAALLLAAGRMAEADALLTEAAQVRQKVQDYATNLNGNIIVRTNWLIAAGRAPEAAPLLKGFTVREAPAASVSVTRLQRSIQLARVELALRHPQEVLEALRDLRQLVAGNRLQQYLKTYEGDADQLEGKANMLLGRPEMSLPLLQQAHSLYSEVYDARTSLALADAKVALADCLLKLGRITDARRLAAEAAAIHAVHRQIGEQYRQPLRALQTLLGAA